MPKRTRASRGTRSPADRLRSIVGTPKRRPREALVVLRDVLFVTVASTFLLRFVVWEPLEATVAAPLERAKTDSMELLALTPFDLLLFQTRVGLVAGLLVGIARVWALYWQWRRRNAPIVDDWTLASPTVGIPVGALLLFAIASVGSVPFAVAVFTEPLVPVAQLSDAPRHGQVLQTTMLVVVLALAVGVGAVLAFGLAVLATEGVAPASSVAVGGAVAVAVAAGVGYRSWADVPLGRPAWIGPLFVGYVFGLLLAVVCARRSGGRRRRRRRSRSSRRSTEHRR